MAKISSKWMWALILGGGLAAAGGAQLSGKLTPPAPVFPRGNTGHLRTPQMCALYHFGTSPDDPKHIHRTGAIAIDNAGNIYGAGPQGGAHNHGAVFKLSPDGKLTNLHDFNWTDGSGPEGGVTLGSDGKLYGTTVSGGDGKSGPYSCTYKTGVLYSLDIGGGFHTIWDFRNGWLRPLKSKDDHHTEREIMDSRGSYPVSPPVQTKSGQWFGVTGKSNNFELGIFYTIGFEALQIFDGLAANFPVSLSPGVLDDSVYGVTWGGAKSNPFGTVFAGGGNGFRVIHTFKNTDGAKPLNVIQGKDGRLYGTTTTGSPDKIHGLIYSMTTAGGDYKILHVFDQNKGGGPWSGVVWGSDNRLYGATVYGGKANRGVFYRIDPDGKNFTVLHTFKTFETGRKPTGRIIEGNDRNFYGTTYEGGVFDKGVVFKLDAGLSAPKDPESFGERWCCALGQGAGNGTKVLDPTEIEGHHYGGGDAVGFVYTSRVGLVDLGHVRNNADKTRYIYDYLMVLPRAGTYGPISLFNGDLQVYKLPDDQDDILEMAGAIAYIDAWAHELTTWDQYWFKSGSGFTPTPSAPQDFSAFSPEDLVSNVIGIQAAKNAIRRGCEVKYNEAMDAELLRMFREFGVMSAAETQDRMNSIYGVAGTSHAGKWYTENAVIWETLWRRNFYVNPWLIPYANVGAYRPAWLTTEYFKKYWDGTWFDYTIRDSVDGKTGVTLKSMQAHTDAIHGKWIKDNPGMDKWP
jgi:uncharacterized repeat protein (TIGR03803 family)